MVMARLNSLQNLYQISNKMGTLVSFCSEPLYKPTPMYILYLKAQLTITDNNSFNTFNKRANKAMSFSHVHFIKNWL